MLMQMLQKHHHLHERLYGVSIHMDLAFYETSSKIGECIEFSHGSEKCQNLPVIRSLEDVDADAEETSPPT